MNSILLFNFKTVDAKLYTSKKVAIFLFDWSTESAFVFSQTNMKNKKTVVRATKQNKPCAIQVSLHTPMHTMVTGYQNACLADV